MEKNGDDDKILSYDDVVLRRSDLGILSGPNFLNDQIIEFYFSYLSSNLKDNSVLLVPPSIAQWIKECKGSIKDFVEPLNFPSKKLILFPVNDNNDVNWADGGSHWTLLVFYRAANVFVNHDSLGGKSSKAFFDAYRLCMALRPYTSKDAELVECPSAPRQVNGYDCGVYVMAVAKAVCEWFEKESEKAKKKIAEFLQKKLIEPRMNEPQLTDRWGPRHDCRCNHDRPKVQVPYLLRPYSSRPPPPSYMKDGVPWYDYPDHAHCRARSSLDNDSDRVYRHHARPMSRPPSQPKVEDPCPSSADGRLWYDDLDHITPSAITLMRSETMDLIISLMEEK